MSYGHEINDSDWERIKDKPVPENKGKGIPSKSNRTTLNGMLWINKTSSPWRDLPEQCSSWKSVYSRFNLWSENGVF